MTEQNSKTKKFDWRLFTSFFIYIVLSLAVAAVSLAVAHKLGYHPLLGLIPWALIFIVCYLLTLRFQKRN